MDVMATRGWGIAASGAMIAGALIVAFTAPARQAPEQTPWVAPTASDAPAARAAPATLIVHFRGRGPLARAERAGSARRVAAELSRQRALRGLCFAHFEPRGVALRACDARAGDAWPQRLRAMRAVARVETGD